MNTAVGTLVREAERLDNRSLDAFIENIISLRIRRDTSDKQREEALLLKKINKGLPLKQVERLRTLNQKRIDCLISDSEYTELTNLLEQTEKYNVRRLKYIIALARLRNSTVRELMKQLGLSPANG